MLRVRLLLPPPCQSAVTTSQLNCPLLFCKITLKGICKIVEYITFGGRFTVLGFDPNRMRMNSELGEHARQISPTPCSISPRLVR
jgi:hypothetical protein